MAPFYSIAAEFWTDRVQPWVHYVPIQVDYSDIYDALLFVSVVFYCLLISESKV